MSVETSRSIAIVALACKKMALGQSYMLYIVDVVRHILTEKPVIAEKGLRIPNMGEIDTALHALTEAHNMRERHQLQHNPEEYRNQMLDLAQETSLYSEILRLDGNERRLPQSQNANIWERIKVEFRHSFAIFLQYLLRLAIGEEDLLYNLLLRLQATLSLSNQQ